MKLDSKYFDRIRVKPDRDRRRKEQAPGCDWPRCGERGEYPAPVGRDQEGRYHRFCLEHVRQYNKRYNYFSGMAEEEWQAWRQQAEIGHRPTWRLGRNSWAELNGGRLRGVSAPGWRDPHGALAGEEVHVPTQAQRKLRNGERRALFRLGLDETATGDDIKKRYKTLVKRLHPDANGGSRANEDKLREVIRAYDYLRAAGLC